MNTNMKELNLEEMVKIAGGELSDKDKRSIENLAGGYKKMGATLEQFLNILAKPSPEAVEYIRSIWNTL